MDRPTSVPRLSGLVAPLPELIPALVALLLVVQSLAAAMLLARRLSGAIAPAAAPGWLLGWVLMAALLAAATRVLWFVGRQRVTLAGEAVVLWAPLASLVVMATALTAGGSPALVTAVIWLVTIAEEAATLLLVARGSGFALSAIRSRGGAQVARPTQSGAEAPVNQIRPPAAPLERHVQRIERVQGADGCDRLSGSVAISFSPGQTRQAIHVAFCPPFATMPSLEFRQTAGPPASVKVGQLLPHGVRFDIKLERTSDVAMQAVVEVRAACETPVNADEET